MLLRFAVEPEAFLSENFSNDIPAMKSYLKDLQEFWGNHGVLIIPGKLGQFLERCHAVDSEMHPKLQDLFSTFWPTSERRWEFRYVEEPQPISLGDVQEEEDLQVYSGHLDMAILDPVRAVAVGLAEDEYCNCAKATTTDTIPEVTRWHLVKRTCKVTKLSEISSKPTTVGDTPDTIWSERLEKYAQYSEDIVIADPYCTWNLGINGDPQNDGLIVLLNHLFNLYQGSKGSRKPLRVTVYGTYNPKDSPGEPNSMSSIRGLLEREIERMYNGRSRLKEIRFYMIGRPDHGDKHAGLFHDRWLRFNHHTFILGQGLTVFSPRRHKNKKTVGPRYFVLTDEYCTQGLEEVETALRHICKEQDNFRIELA